MINFILGVASVIILECLIILLLWGGILSGEKEYMDNRKNK